MSSTNVSYIYNSLRSPSSRSGHLITLTAVEVILNYFRFHSTLLTNWECEHSLICKVLQHYLLNRWHLSQYLKLNKPAREQDQKRYISFSSMRSTTWGRKDDRRSNTQLKFKRRRNHNLATFRSDQITKFTKTLVRKLYWFYQIVIRVFLTRNFY